MKPNDQCLEVWGDFACFTRPELKVERFSYPVITPSAARGIYDAIYCKPKEFRWQITKVEILSLPKYIALRRNEVNGVASTQNAAKWMTGKPAKPLMADDDRIREQRQTLALRGVKYRLHAEIRPWSEYADRLPAFESQFRRRASAGKCVYQPYFGCREFPAYFKPVGPGEFAEPAIQYDDHNLGWVLYDVYDLSQPGTSESPCQISLFQPVITGGVVEVPDYMDDAVRRSAKEVSRVT